MELCEERIVSRPVKELVYHYKFCDRIYVDTGNKVGTTIYQDRVELTNCGKLYEVRATYTKSKQLRFLPYYVIANKPKTAKQCMIDKGLSVIESVTEIIGEEREDMLNRCAVYLTSVDC